MFFESWQSLGRVVLVASIVYVGLILALRVAGSRALAKMSAYDLVVTIALGSLIATIPLQQRITLADGFAAIITYLVLQRAMSWMLRRWERSRKIAKTAPHLLLYEGRLLQDRMADTQVSEAEMRAAVRAAGMVSFSECLAIVLENDGTWSVIPRSDAEDRSALEGLDVPVPAS